MIITRTPFRVSMFGGGTDYPGWYREHGGAVLSTTIDKYCYISARHLPPFFEHRFRVVYSQIESANTIEEIEHPSVRATLNFMNLNRGIEIHHDGDLPARSGMGSSSSFTVGLLNALHALKGHMATKEQLANESIQVEQDILNETVGSQDQVNAAYGGFNHITFHQSGEISVRPVIVPSDRLEELTSHLMLFYTGIKRTADKVAGSYVPSLEAKRRQLRILRDMVEEALSILCGHGLGGIDRGIEVGIDPRAVCAIGPVAGDHDIVPTRQGPFRQALPGVAAHDDGLAHGCLLEQGEIVRQFPWKAAFLAYDAVTRTRDDHRQPDRVFHMVSLIIAPLIAGA